MLDLNYLDLVFDCHEIDKLDAIKENSLDVITLTNALDHLKRPIVFLNRAANKLKLGGKVIATEPFFSAINCHLQVSDQEALDFRISEPELGEMQGPLASANIALPWLIFFRRRERPQPFNDNFDLASLSAWPFSALSYMAPVECRAGCGFRVFFIACYSPWTSPSVAALPASAQLFSV